MMDGKPAAADKRHALVVGDEPRIAPLEMDTLTDDLSKIIVRMIEVNATLESRERGQLTGLMSGHSSASDISMQLADLPEVIRTMVRHADLFVRHVDVGLYLLRQGTLSARDRELAILRIGWLCQAPYEWGEHEQAIIRATEELHTDAMISDSTWATLAKTLGEKQLIELPIVVGQYQTLAYYQNSLRLRLHDGNLGLHAR